MLKKRKEWKDISGKQQHVQISWCRFKDLREVACVWIIIGQMMWLNVHFQNIILYVLKECIGHGQECNQKSCYVISGQKWDNIGGEDEEKLSG
jgi:hypothetical protein